MALFGDFGRGVGGFFKDFGSSVKQNPFMTLATMGLYPTAKGIMQNEQLSQEVQKVQADFMPEQDTMLTQDIQATQAAQDTYTAPRRRGTANTILTSSSGSPSLLG